MLCGGCPVFIAGENGPRVTRSDFRAFQHPANTVIGDYPGFNEVNLSRFVGQEELLRGYARSLVVCAMG